MSNVINLQDRMKKEQHPVQSAMLDKEALGRVITILVDLHEDGECTLNDLAIAFVTLGDMVNEIMPMFDAILEDRETD